MSNCTCSVNDVAGFVVGGRVNGERVVGTVAMVGTCVRRRGVEKHTRLTEGANREGEVEGRRRRGDGVRETPREDTQP